ncbi:heavy metal-responsive transcriptional regulator [Marinithermus hydrothermalis]|uniref:Transcriptional regulator, MerR family n=1 Tax=Marinithermus hydrothermalis (strain DSM 14884 / JCM 11576 / T1) TaxID=869210 RepID=F2NNS6_MARHT|nr:heavy metal-responsive transcriptional regulator [Marinithermus hydrothermalis]AEB11300.1 transcriptional regulator, MerR family [Marinithermus hydrothermalis DSM 14884]
MRREPRIGEVARALGLSPKAIRYYEAIGLLPPPRRTPAGYRVYGEADLERLRFVQKAKASGLTLSEIREVLTLWEAGTPPCDRVRALLDRKIAEVEAEIRALLAFRAELRRLRRAASRRGREQAVVCAILERTAG